MTLGRRDQLVEGAVVALLARAARACHEVRFDYAAASGEGRAAGPSPTGWSPPPRAGTCSPGTSTGRTGAASGSTG